MSTEKVNLNLTCYVPLQESACWTDDDIEIISKKCGLSHEDIRLILKWNVLTVSQISLLTNLKQSTIRNTLTPIVKKNGHISTRLCMVNVFPDSGYGKHFVFVDDFCKRFILK